MSVSRTWRTLISLQAISAVAGWAPSELAGSQVTSADSARSRELPPPAHFPVHKLSGTIRVDGVMNEPFWGEAVPIALDYEFRPGDNVAPPVETECRVTYDAARLYVGCRAFDPAPHEIRAHLADRDDLERTTQDDHIVVLLDTFNDERRSFQFRVNPLGVQMDAVLSTAEESEDFSWDAIWASAGRITDFGYVVEMGIPFRSLRFPKTQAPQTWGVILSRSYPRSVRHRIRSMPTDRNNTCLLCQANKLYGFEGISPGMKVELVPTFTSSRTDERTDVPDGSIESGDVEAEPGLDLRWGITSNVTLNGTVNPDFSQVEADVAQLDVNERFALFFPEKRPFFLEGADFFTTPLQAVFTRTVTDPQGGIKLTGKEGAHGLGVFAARDRVTNLLFPANQGSRSAFLDTAATTGVVRYRRDVGRASNVGVLYTGRVSEGYYNHLYGADAFFQLSRSNTIRVQYLRSDTDYPDAVADMYGQASGPFAGGGLHLEFGHSSRNWVGGVAYDDRSPHFRADAGFIPRVDLRTIDGFFGRIFWEGSWFTQMAIATWGMRTYDHQGTLTDQSFGMFVVYEGPSQTSFDLEFGRDKQLFRGVEHELTQFTPRFEMQPSGAVTLGIRSRIGDVVDFANSRKSFLLSLSPNAQLSVGRHVTLGVSHNLQRLTHEGSKVFTANLTQGTLRYQFGVRTFLRAIVQFQDISRNTAAYVEPPPPDTRTVFTQFLFSYKLNPQSVLFVGYSDNHLGTDSFGLRQMNRTFFTKLGYAWRP